MDILILINQIIFSVLLSLLLLELSAAILSLADYETYKERLTSYIAPTWEITGTFSVFYLVNLEATYPGLLVAIGTTYILPVLVALFFVIIRDAFLAYTEYIGSEKDEKRFARVYGISTIAMMLTIITILGSTISGIGINISTYSLNPLFMIFNPFNFLLIISLVAFVTFATGPFFNLKRKGISLISIIVALCTIVFALAISAPFMLQNLASNIIVVVPSLVLLIVILVLYLMDKSYTKFLVLPWLFFSVLAFQLLEYPSLFNGVVQINNYLTAPASATYVLIITIAGAILLAVALSLFVYVHRLHKETKFHEQEY